MQQHSLLLAAEDNAICRVKDDPARHVLINKPLDDLGDSEPVHHEAAKHFPDYHDVRAVLHQQLMVGELHLDLVGDNVILVLDAGQIQSRWPNGERVSVLISRALHLLARLETSDCMLEIEAESEVVPDHCVYGLAAVKIDSVYLFFVDRR